MIERPSTEAAAWGRHMLESGHMRLKRSLVLLAVTVVAAFGALGGGIAWSATSAHHRHLSVCRKRASKHKKHRCRQTKKTVTKPGLRAPSPSPAAKNPALESAQEIEAEEKRSGQPPHTEGSSYPCVLVTPPSLPPGDGWVRGSLLSEGGPPPGSLYCGGPLVVVVSSSGGSVVASQHIGPREEWAIPLPPGTYSLAAFTEEGKRVECSSEPAMFVIAVGEESHDSVECDIP
jgi:hypothetical protein